MHQSMLYGSGNKLMVSLLISKVLQHPVMQCRQAYLSAHYLRMARSHAGSAELMLIGKPPEMVATQVQYFGSSLYESTFCVYNKLPVHKLQSQSADLAVILTVTHAHLNFSGIHS